WPGHEMGARQYNPGYGRFVTPDENLADQDVGDPLSWNLYAYARNNPLRYADPTGRACVQQADGGYADDGGPGQSCAEATSNRVGHKVTVAEIAPPSDLLLAVALGAQRASSSVESVGTGFKALGLALNAPLTLGITCLAGDPECDGTGIAFAVVPGVRPTGQLHHAISKRIARALARHNHLKFFYRARDPRFVTQAIDGPAHRGYQRWHRDLDTKVETWLEDNPLATKVEFEKYLRDLYSHSEDLAKRFPLGLQ
ncbi:MAG: hypothetical protein JNM66_21870, partial [Bryobacterales bacterium]|nr:hypothetical protein [Bryobacterales bacterium]